MRNGSHRRSGAGSNSTDAPKETRGKGNDQGIPFRDADPSTGELPLDDLDTFLIPSRDEKGVSAHLSLNVPPFMDRYIQIVLRSGRFPYVRGADLIRHAIYRHLHWLSEIRQSMPKSQLAGMDAVIEICRDDEIRMQTEAAFSRLNERIESHYLQQNFSEAIRLLTLVKTRIDQVQSSPWKTKFVKDLWERHGHMLNVASSGEVTVKPESQLLTGHSELLDTPNDDEATH